MAHQLYPSAVTTALQRPNVFLKMDLVFTQRLKIVFALGAFEQPISCTEWTYVV